MEKLKEFTVLTKALTSFIKLVILVIVAIVLGIQLASMTDRGTPTTIEDSDAIPVAGVVDLIAGIPVNVNIASAVEKEEVYKMPEFVLSAPESEWFSNVRMQMIGKELGLTNRAAVKNFGSQAVWQEGNKMLMISPRIGQIDFSTAFNFGTVELPSTNPTSEKAGQAVKEFLTNAQIPQQFLDLDNLQYEYMYVDEMGSMSSSITQTGDLIKVTIPYSIVGVRVLLPIDSYVLVDGDGKIQILSLLLPNIKQTDQMLTLINWSKARDKLQKGEGGLISGQVSDTLMVDSSYPAYYLRQSDFYKFDQRRYFIPVYIFEGDNNQAVVLASQE